MPVLIGKEVWEIERIRECCQIVAEVLRLLKQEIRPGVKTSELNEMAEDYIYSCNAIPAFKGYGFEKHNPFPASLCISIDDEVVHGIPGQRALVQGEIVSIDVGVKKDGYYGDGAWTFQVGQVSPEKQKLLKVTEESLYKGIEQARLGNHVHDISAAIQQHVESAGFSVVRELVGHGVGKYLHEEPQIPNYGKRGTGAKLKKGLTLAIEPMVNAGSPNIRVDSDGWTVRTVDHSPSAHFEHTILITEDGPEILTS